MIQDVLPLEINLGGQAVQLPFHLGADAAVQCDPRQSKTRRYGSRDGLHHRFGFLIFGHDWSCIPRLGWGWICGYADRIQFSTVNCSLRRITVGHTKTLKA
jgi:hypothetical protein